MEKEYLENSLTKGLLEVYSDLEEFGFTPVEEEPIYLVANSPVWGAGYTQDDDKYIVYACFNFGDSLQFEPNLVQEILMSGIPESLGIYILGGFEIKNLITYDSPQDIETKIQIEQVGSFLDVLSDYVGTEWEGMPQWAISFELIQVKE